MTQLQPRVVDISHHNPVHDLGATANAGIWGIIHKASQGSGYKDPDYDKNRKLALAAGMLFGSYHFNDGTDVTKQVDWFLRCAKPDNTTLLVLDFEDNPKSNMSIQQAVQFLRLIEKKTGRKAAIYSGNRLKENIGKLNNTDRAYVTSHPLWLCQYSAAPKLPAGFTGVFLWQYTDGHFGPPPHGISGISGDVDLNTFRGTREDLEAVWISSNEPLILESDASSHSSRAAQDQPDVATTESTRSDSGSVELPTFVPADSDTPEPALNVQPVKAAYSLDVEIAQRKLDRLGYHEVGDMDGRWGGKTKGALTAFLNDRGSPIQVNGGFTPEINNAISTALAEGWSRPIAASRANATAKDIAPKVESVRLNLWQRFMAKITAGVATLGFTGSTLSGTFDTIKEKTSGIREVFDSIPTPVWFLIVGAVAGLTWYLTSRAAESTTKDYNVGKVN